MKKQRVLALLLCLALLCTLIPGVFAANDNTSSKGMEISKTATANGDGTYTVTLEAYATGEVTTETTVEFIYEINHKMMDKAQRKQAPAADGSKPSLNDQLYALGGVHYVNLVVQSDEIS